jgi:hypothetical protein
MSTHETKALTPPSSVKMPAWAMGLAVLALVAGGAAFALNLKAQPTVAWGAWLIGAFYALGLAVFGVLWVSILHVSKGDWSVTLRRIPEAMTAWVVPGGAAAIAVVLGGREIYMWMHAATVAADPALVRKAAFLNSNLFIGLIGLSVALWALFAFLLVRNSRAQDASGAVALTRANRTLSALFIVVYAITFSIATYYLLLSIETHWSSTMYAVLTFTDMMQSGLAFMALIAAGLMMGGKLDGFVNENHLHSLGKMLFAATGFWAYIFFCQFLLIWYANIPEEVVYFVRRFENGWMPYLMVLPFLKFIVPFIVLVPRAAKRSPAVVALMALVVLVGQFLELYLLVAPGLGAHGEHGVHAHAPLIEALVTVGFLGAFFLVFALVYGRNNPVPLKDPRLRKCLELHQ